MPPPCGQTENPGRAIFSGLHGFASIFDRVAGRSPFPQKGAASEVRRQRGKEMKFRRRSLAEFIGEIKVELKFSLFVRTSRGKCGNFVHTI